MGQYFYFRDDTGMISKKSLRWNFGLSWIKSFERMDESEQIKIFKEVMELNGWKKGKISAVGDYGDIIIYDSESQTIDP
jgi:hypothetical protein